MEKIALGGAGAVLLAIAAFVAKVMSGGGATTIGTPRDFSEDVPLDEEFVEYDDGFYEDD